MKKLTSLCLALAALFFITSCGSSGHARRGCTGKGSWYGNRGLGYMDKVDKQDQKTYYAVISKEEMEQN